jgi:citrate lyase subunit beta-like protein
MISQCTEVKRDVRIIAVVELALGILSLREISKTSQKDSKAKLDALVFALEDYSMDIEAIPTPSATELLYTHSKLVTVAKAYGIQASDMVHIDFRDMHALEKEHIARRQLGFMGKQAVHPGQVETIQRNFEPSRNDIDFVARCLQKYESSTAAGQGACVVDGIEVDLPVYKWSQKMVVRAKQAGLL